MTGAVAASPPRGAAPPASRLRETALSWAPIAAIVAGFLALAFSYSVQVPVYEAPDEIAHAQYANFLATHTRLPDIPQSYEGWQPPLYYAVGGLALRALGLDSLPSLEVNPSRGAESNFYFHTADESFPYSDPALAVHVLRWITALFGAATLVVVYLTALLLFPQRKLLAFSAAATAGLVPQFAFMSGSVDNDMPAVFFASLVTYFGLRLLKEGHVVWGLGAAVALSLGGLTKTTALWSGVVPLLAIFMSPAPWPRRGQMLSLLIALPLSTAGLFQLRNLIIWGDVWPGDLIGGSRPLDLWDPAYRRVFLGLVRESYWYMGGWMSVKLSPIIHDALNVISVLALGGVIVAFVSNQLSAFQRQGLLLLGLLCVVALLCIVYVGVRMDFQPQGRYLFVAQPGFAILFTLGLGALFSRDVRVDHPMTLALPLVLIAVNVSIFTINLPRAY